MHGSACSAMKGVSLLGLLAVLGVAMVGPTMSRIQMIRPSLRLEVAALAPHANKPRERNIDPMIDLERVPPRRAPVGIQLASFGRAVLRPLNRPAIGLWVGAIVGSMPGASTNLPG